MNSNCSSKLVGTCDAFLVQATGMPSMARVQKYNGQGLASRQSLMWTVSDHSSCTESNIVICFFSNDDWAIKLRMAECHSYQHHENNTISNKRNKHIFLNTKSHSILVWKQCLLNKLTNPDGVLRIWVQVVVVEFC